MKRCPRRSSSPPSSARCAAPSSAPCAYHKTFASWPPRCQPKPDSACRLAFGESTPNEKILPTRNDKQPSSWYHGTMLGAVGNLIIFFFTLASIVIVGGFVLTYASHCLLTIV